MPNSNLKRKRQFFLVERDTDESAKNLRFHAEDERTFDVRLLSDAIMIITAEANNDYSENEIYVSLHTPQQASHLQV